MGNSVLWRLPSETYSERDANLGDCMAGLMRSIIEIQEFLQ
jgi:hypothetical protein